VRRLHDAFGMLVEHLEKIAFAGQQFAKQHENSWGMCRKYDVFMTPGKFNRPGFPDALGISVRRVLRCVLLAGVARHATHFFASPKK
jgi:hypothetical protein